MIGSFWGLSRQSLTIGIIGAGVGLVLGILAGLQPLLLCLAIAAIIVVIVFFAYFEQTVLGLLILRSSIDIFSDFGIPAAFAIGIDVLTILYVVTTLLLGREVITDKFFWFFASWVAIQSLWLILLPLGGLGLGAYYLPISMREWVRLFSWLMVYLLVMQLKGKIHPKRLIDILMLSLIVPLTVAFIQVIVPPGMLPPLLVYRAGQAESLVVGEGSRIFGTLGHPNGFARLLFLFIALTLWKLECTKKRRFWIVLLCILIFFFVTTQALMAIGLFGIFLIVRFGQNISFSRLIGGVILFALFIGLFASTEFGRQRLSSIADTPLLNPDISLSDAVLLSEGNSFNWRIAHWTYLLQAWQKYPILGYGIHSSRAIPIFHMYAHNDYVRALVEGGIVGLITFLAFLGVQFQRVLYLYTKAPSKSDLHRLCSVLLAILIAFFLGMATDNVLSNTVVYFYWWTILAVAGWDWDDYTNNKATNSS